jgi:hypothetical protein
MNQENQNRDRQGDGASEQSPRQGQTKQTRGAGRESRRQGGHGSGQFGRKNGELNKADSIVDE